MNEQSEAQPSKGSYFVIFLLIAALIIIAVAVSFAGLGASAVYANLLIAGAQSCLLAYFFMHLKEAEQLTWLICGAGIFWLVIMFVLLLNDYITRGIAAY
jgi:cytochrome c oxidase subunit IV